jgi:hypothetical protein
VTGEAFCQLLHRAAIKSLSDASFLRTDRGLLVERMSKLTLLDSQPRPGRKVIGEADKTTSRRYFRK